jgi:hypothetical protein
MCNLSRNTFLAVALTSTIFFSVPHSQAQNPALQEKLAAIKDSSAANKQALAHYTWLEQQTISLKGEVKKTQQFQVQIGPDGQQQKTELNPQAAPQPSGGRLRQHVVAKKTDEFEAYGQQIAALGKQYAQLDMQALQQAYQQGNVSMQPNSAAGTVSLIIKSYLKPNDSVTLVFSEQQKAIQSVQVASCVSKQLGVMTQNSMYQPLR